MNRETGIGKQMYDWAHDLFPVCRSITGDGVRSTLAYLKNIHPEMEIGSIKSGEKVFDWIVPDEWNIAEAYIADIDGKRIVDFRENNLHILSYSAPVNKKVPREELFEHLYTRPDLPDAIPYVTSYYSRNWGFCMSDKMKQELTDDEYHVFVDSSFTKGEMNYGEIFISGETTEEIVFSTYICHPSMANNELSGVVMATALAQFVKSLNKRKYSYRFLFIPETIGSIAYLSKHMSAMKRRTKCGFVLTCVGNEDHFSFMPSRTGNTYADKVALFVLSQSEKEFKKYSFLERGSDERQYCSPRVDLPIVSIMRSKYKEYKEYHTSLDNMGFITSNALKGTFDIYVKCIQVIETNEYYLSTTFCEPMLSKRQLYPEIGGQVKSDYVKLIKNIIAYADASMDMMDMSIVCQAKYEDLAEAVSLLVDKDLLQPFKR
jgi:aminopeptidase-like protein